MKVLAALVGVILIVLPLIDAFEAILQPRRVTHRFRYAQLFYRGTWGLWRSGALAIRPGRSREAYLSIFGPLSLFGLTATWVAGLVLGFGLLFWSLGVPLRPQNEQATFLTYCYMSGITFFTLGYGDFTPASNFGRVLAVVEAGLGFGYLAAIIGYFPTLFQAYSRREVAISLLDARAGSPPTACEALRRAAASGDCEAIVRLLVEWERWSAELLSSHLSFPVLSYYRSQHDNQSWLAALAAMLDVCAIMTAKLSGMCSYQAQLTFAMARHAAVDLALVLKIGPATQQTDRVSTNDMRQILGLLREAGWTIDDRPDSNQRLEALRATYEPFLDALGGHLLYSVPPLMCDGPAVDNWQKSGWMKRTPGIGNFRAPAHDGQEHFN